MAQKLKDRALARVLQIMTSRRADFIVGTEADPYLKRWRLTPRWLMPLCAIYAHEFCRDDDDVPHDHPYLINISWILRIGYFEHQFSPLARRMSKQGFDPDYRSDLICFWRPEGAIIWRLGWTAHRVQLKVFNVAQISGQSFVISEGMAVKDMVRRVPHPITLFFCGPRVREWGFYCPQGWKHYKDYIAPTSYGNRVGKGCGE